MFEVGNIFDSLATDLPDKLSVSKSVKHVDLQCGIGISRHVLFQMIGARRDRH